MRRANGRSELGADRAEITGNRTKTLPSCLTGNAYSNFTSAGIVVASTFWLTGAGSEPVTWAPVDSKIRRFTCSLRHSWHAAL